MSTCDCKLWDKNIDVYNVMFNWCAKYHGPVYDGAEFAFCPWCGKETIIDEQEYEEYEDDEDDDEDDEDIDTTPMHGDEEDDDDDEEDFEEVFEVEFEEISYPMLHDGWCSEN